MPINTTDDQRNKVRAAIDEPNAAWNEVIWTYLVADVIAHGGNEQAIAHLFGTDLHSSSPWFEAMPVPPRENEGNTRIDLALGDIQKRASTDNGIEFAGDRTPSWVGFVEAKVLSDCSIDVTKDPTRNQITRVIENLLCFQSADGQMPERLQFTILTPRHFRDARNRRSRLYGYKFDEYSADASMRILVQDIGLSRLDVRNRRDWRYPADLQARVAKLQLHWAAYEDILSCDSELRGIDVMDCVSSRVLPLPVRARLSRSLAENL